MTTARDGVGKLEFRHRHVLMVPGDVHVLGPCAVTVVFWDDK